MGKRGPAPTPTEILKLRGSWRANLREGEPQPEKGKPPCPRHLTKPQRVVWKKLCAILEDMNVLTTADGSQLERYAVYYCRWRDCEEFLAKNGVTYPLKSADPYAYVGKLADGSYVIRFIEYPQVRESHRLDAALKQIEAQFGLTPAARARLTVGSEPEGDDFEDFVRGRKSS